MLNQKAFFLFMVLLMFLPIFACSTDQLGPYHPSNPNLGPGFVDEVHNLETRRTLYDGRMWVIAANKSNVFEDVLELYVVFGGLDPTVINSTVITPEWGRNFLKQPLAFGEIDTLFFITEQTYGGVYYWAVVTESEVQAGGSFNVPNFKDDMNYYINIF